MGGIQRLFRAYGRHKGLYGGHVRHVGVYVCMYVCMYVCIDR